MAELTDLSPKAQMTLGRYAPSQPTVEDLRGRLAAAVSEKEARVAEIDARLQDVEDYRNLRAAEAELKEERDVLAEADAAIAAAGPAYTEDGQGGQQPEENAQG